MLESSMILPISSFAKGACDSPSATIPAIPSFVCINGDLLFSAILKGLSNFRLGFRIKSPD